MSHSFFNLKLLWCFNINNVTFNSSYCHSLGICKWFFFFIILINLNSFYEKRHILFLKNIFLYFHFREKIFLYRILWGFLHHNGRQFPTLIESWTEEFSGNKILLKSMEWSISVLNRAILLAVFDKKYFFRPYFSNAGIIGEWEKFPEMGQSPAHLPKFF